MVEVAKILEHQLSLLSHLKSVIGEENKALTSQDAEKLLNLAKEKSDCLIKLQQNDSQLASPEHIEFFSTSKEYSDKAIQAKAMLKECKDLNQQNASLIEHSIASLNRLSQALQASRNAFSLTYDDKGKTSTISTLGNKLEA
ncbi:MAG: flagellar protein FlgN [Shewanella sp.]|nr:flagellar protein FlgN [Shewanella sp.]